MRINFKKPSYFYFSYCDFEGVKGKFRRSGRKVKIAMPVIAVAVNTLFSFKQWPVVKLDEIACARIFLVQTKR